jgi:hypothetical protein
MLTKILILTGTILLAVFITMVSFNNQQGWSFLLPSILLLALGGLAHDLSHPRPRRREVEDTERHLKRKKRRVKVASY